MILPVFTWQQPVLREQAAPVQEFGSALKPLATNLEDTMRGAYGIGLAAPQIGLSTRALFVGYEDAGIPFLFITNPEIVWRSREKSLGEEACLSLPGVFGDVKRPEAIRVRYQDAEGRQREIAVDGLFARVLQHEIDHLNGVLFTDYIPEAELRQGKHTAYPTV